MEVFFPERPGVDRTRLRIHEVGRYSVSLPRDAEENARLMCEVLERLAGLDAKDLHITDACACVGGDSLALARRFARVTAVELDPGTHDILRHNLAVYAGTDLGHQGVVVHDPCDCTQLFRDPEWTSDVVYIDPPWNQAGRPWHSQLPSVMPQLSGKGLDAVVADLLGRSIARPVMVVCKCPWNFDFTRFTRTLSKMDCVMLTHRVNKYFLVCCVKKSMSA